jgi:hypothetical protein
MTRLNRACAFAAIFLPTLVLAQSPSPQKKQGDKEQKKIVVISNVKISLSNVINLAGDSKPGPETATKPTDATKDPTLADFLAAIEKIPAGGPDVVVLSNVHVDVSTNISLGREPQASPRGRPAPGGPPRRPGAQGPRAPVASDRGRIEFQLNELSVGNNSIDARFVGRAPDSETAKQCVEFVRTAQARSLDAIGLWMALGKIDPTAGSLLRTVVKSVVVDVDGARFKASASIPRSAIDALARKAWFAVCELATPIARR